MVKEILTLAGVRQLLTHSDSTGVEAMSDRTRPLPEEVGRMKQLR